MQFQLSLFCCVEFGLGVDYQYVLELKFHYDSALVSVAQKKSTFFLVSNFKF